MKEILRTFNEKFRILTLPCPIQEHCLSLFGLCGASEEDRYVLQDVHVKDR